MAIEFDEIFNMDIPFVQAELSKAVSLTGTVKQEYTALIFGQKTTEGTAPTGQVLDIFSHEEAQTKFGKTSMLAHAIGRYYDINKSVKLKVIALDDEGGGSEAVGTLTLAGTVTTAGTFAMYVNGKAYKVAAAVGDTHTEIATALHSKIGEDLTAQFTAADDLAGELTFNAVHKGTYGNTLEIVLNYNIDDVTPAGITPVVVDFASGAGDPDLDNTGVIAILENEQFNLIAQPYTDNATLGLIDVALTDNFKATEMLDGFCIVGVNDTVTNLVTKTEILNSPFITVLDNNTVFSTSFEQAAGMIALVGDTAQSSPGSSFLRKHLLGFLPHAQRITTERNVLAGGGVCTFVVNGSKVLLDRTVTTLQKDENSIALDTDDTDLRLFLTISYVRYAFVVRMSQFQGYKVGGDDDVFGAGIKIITPNLYKQNLILVYQQLVTDAVCENLSGFEDSVIVERVGNRINSSMRIDVINVLLQQAMLINYEI